MKITKENIKKLEEALSKAQGKAQVNVITAERAIEIASKAEKTLQDLSLHLKDRAGASFEFRDEGPAANSYRYSQGATLLRIKRRSSAWYLESLKRVDIFPRTPEYTRAFLTESQRDIAIRNFSSKFSVMKTEAVSA